MKDTAASECEKFIPSKEVRNFPQYFRASENLNIMREVRLWKQHNVFGNDNGNDLFSGKKSSKNCNRLSGVKWVYIKANIGLGTRRPVWLEAIHQDLHSKFDRLYKHGVK